MSQSSRNGANNRGRDSRRSLRGTAHLRLRISMLVIAMVVSVFAVRLVQLQGLDPKQLAARAAASGLVDAKLPAQRGDITDRNGVPLAQSVPGSMIVADPKLTAPDAEKAARALADKLDVDYFDTLAKLKKPKSRFQYIARRVATAKANAVVDALTKEGVTGLDVRDDPLRDYPSTTVGANLLGFIDGEGRPVTGLEKTFNKMLAGKDGKETYEVAAGKRVPLGDNSETDAVDGKPLKLTIDRDLQYYAQQLVENKVHQSQADSGTAIVEDTRTGELLALADYPSFDPNQAGGDPTDWQNRGVGVQYEPGSVEKVLTSSALIDKGKVSPRTQIEVPSVLSVPGGVVHDYFVHPTLHLTLAGAIAYSSNIGVARAASTMSSSQIESYLRKFGLGKRSGIGLPDEAPGSIPAQPWSPLTQANVAFGQGLAVNAVQMAAAINTVANGGEYVSPSLIQGSATGDNGEKVGTDSTTRHRVISRATAKKVTSMMELVTTEGVGTAPGARVVGYNTAGKTGTAQEIDPKTHRYSRLTVSFAGFAPADKPRFTVYVVFRNAKAEGVGGGLTGGPVFRRLMTATLQKYAVPPTKAPGSKLPICWGGSQTSRQCAAG